jgi:thiol-disulfide isomerase/thioredoxin
MRLTPLLSAALLLLGGVGAYLFFAALSPAGNPESRIASVPVTTLSGETTTVGVLREGMPAVVNSWASWCPYCRKELPELESLAQSFDGRIRVIAINRGESPRVGSAYLQQLHTSAAVSYVYDATDAWYRAIGGYMMPETVFIREDGTVAHHQRGVLSLEDMRAYAELLLQDGKAAGAPAESVSEGCTGTQCRGI